MSSPKSLFEERLAPGLAANSGRAKEIGGKFQFQLSGEGGGDWFVDMSSASIQEGVADSADTTIRMDASDFIDMVEGRLPGPQAFMMGKLQIEGDMGLALQLQELFDMQS
jgi:putative sterol carrier protein